MDESRAGYIALGVAVGTFDLGGSNKWRLNGGKWEVDE